MGSIDNQILEHLRQSSELFVGLHSVRRAFVDKLIMRLVLATDTEFDYQSKVKALCHLHCVPISLVSSSWELGKAVGLDIKAGCVGIPM